MKTLVNKNNPAIRITAPEIIETSLYYVLDFANEDNDSETDLFKDEWTLIEEEPTEGIKGNLEEIPSDVDLEKLALEKTSSKPWLREVYLAGLKDGYELGLKARKV